MSSRIYPYYGKHVNGRVVLFTSPNTGTIVENGKSHSSLQVGYKSDKWDETFYNVCDWEPPLPVEGMVEADEEDTFFSEFSGKEFPNSTCTPEGGLPRRPLVSPVTPDQGFTLAEPLEPFKPAYLPSGTYTIAEICKKSGRCVISPDPVSFTDEEDANAEAVRLATENHNTKYMVLQVIGTASVEVLWE